MAEEGQRPVGGGGVTDYSPPADRPKIKHQESIYHSLISQTTADGRIMIGQDMEIFPKKECREFASPGTEAYDVKDRRMAGEQFALLCGRSSVPRIAVIGLYKKLKSRNILKLVDAGLIDWPPEHSRRFALIFEKPAGKKIMESAEAKPFMVSEDMLIPAVIQPAVAALSELANSDTVHGAVNAENAFMTGAPGAETIVLGECLSSPPSFWQHPMYETIPRAMAKPSGRGPGTSKDDIYALGVCVAMMALGENLLLGKSPQQIIYDKIEHGSYGAITGRGRIPGSIAEFLRGALNDDEDQRWSIDDAARWLEGRRAPPKQPHPVPKAARALVFGDQQLLDLRAAAEAFSGNVAAAALEIEKGQFESWLKRNFVDKALKLRLDGIGEKEKQSSPEKLVSRVCMALDPLGPIRFKGLSFFPEGFGTALAEAMLKGEDIQVYGEVISQQLLTSWVSQRVDEIHDASGLTSLFEKCRAALGHRTPGNGIERVLYMLNPGLYCLSPMIRDLFVFSSAGILQELERLSEQEQRPSAVLDRHMIAFISVREPRLIDPHLGYLNSPGKGKQTVGIMRTLAAIQQKFAVGPVPGIMNWLLSMTPPVIEMLHDRDLRRDMSRQLNRLRGSGNLEELLDLVDDHLLIQDDERRFDQARDEYKNLAAEKNDLENYIKRRKNFGMVTGRQISMIASSTLAIVIITGYVVQRFISGF
ncbi:MAG: hypothetical protein K8R48_09015 [Alphaproteobacteria bacterium]|nr:hypothetical protein [Alphaproteobacteria bacterium]